MLTLAHAAGRIIATSLDQGTRHMTRTIFITVLALLTSACAAVPEQRPVVASSAFTPVPSAHAQVSKPADTSSELDCMADCLADETCEACAEMCLR
jgi:hypothetical protein